jgi:hypothetical protein
VCPHLDSPGYVEWLRGYIFDQAIRLVIPGGAFLLAIEPWFEEFQSLLPIAQERRIVYRALSKIEVFEAFQAAPAHLRLLDHHPPSLVITGDGRRPKAGDWAGLGTTFYLKADGRHGRARTDDLLVGPLTMSMVSQAIEQALRTYRQVLLQGTVMGRQAGVTLLMDQTGQVLAKNCFRDVHDEPTRRGTMSLRRTWNHPALIEDAARRLRFLGWQGAAMLEYRIRDSDGSFDFIELNPRYWQSLHLDLLAGIDFPKLQLTWFEGRTVPQPPPPRDVICRDLWPGEISRLVEIWRSDRFASSHRLRETLAFLLRLFDLRVASDYIFPGDRILYFHRAAQVIHGWLRRRA